MPAQRPAHETAGVAPRRNMRMRLLQRACTWLYGPSRSHGVIRCPCPFVPNMLCDRVLWHQGFPITHCQTDRARIESATLTCLSQSGKGWYFQFLRPSGAPKQVLAITRLPLCSLPAGSSLSWIRDLVFIVVVAWLSRTRSGSVVASLPPAPPPSPNNT